MDFEFPECPFQPGYPVDSDNFKGRSDEVKKVLRYIPTVKKGKQKHYFVTGERGMGKTSFVKYIAKLVETNYDLVPIYVDNLGNESLDVLIGKLVYEVYKACSKRGFGEKIKNLFNKYVDEIDLSVIGIKFKEHNEELIYSIKEDFPSFLMEMRNELKEKEGILIIIDDINGLSKEASLFTNWYKSFTDTLSFNEDDTPFVFCLVSYPNEFNSLSLANSSFSRIFERIIIDNIDDNIIREFFEDEFSKQNIDFADEDSLNMMVEFSYGMPLVMQQIGFSVFWLVDNKIITKDLALKGIIDASEEFGNKEISPILNKIRSEDYINILIKIGGNCNYRFKKSELKDILTLKEFNKVGDFLLRAKELGIIKSVGREKSGEYEFTNRLYFTYFMIQYIKKDIGTNL